MTDHTPQAPPLFTVIIPVYNRAQLVLRAIKSVLDDPAADVEVIVVDDASTDDTADHVDRLQDPRLQLIRLAVNGGRCPARNTGARAGRGEWLIFLDSDDELAPGALEAVRERVQNATDSIGKLLFACRYDSGLISPSPALEGQIVDYVGYLQWTESTADGMSEMMPCTRRTAFLQCPYPEQRDWQETIHELTFVQRTLVQLCPEVVRLYHVDALVRVMVPDAAGTLAAAQGYAEHAEAVLAAHGKALRKYAPRRWLLVTREAALNNFFRGNRRHGIAHSFSVLRAAPANVNAWGTLIGGAIAPGLFVHIWTLRRARITS